MVEEAGDVCWGGAERRGGEELVGCSAVPHLLVAVADFLRSVVLAVGDPWFFCSALVVPATERAVKGPPCLVGTLSTGRTELAPPFVLLFAWGRCALLLRKQLGKCKLGR